MNILIVENEIYLARSIASKLSDFGYECHIVSNIKEALVKEKYDAVLLSTNISNQNIYPVIEKHKNSIIILMISYISNDTVSKPLKAGANDYIQKPFMIEELVRKLQHLKEFTNIKNQNKMYELYLQHSFKDVKLPQIDKKIKLPLLIKTKSQKHADAFMFEFAKFFNKSFYLYSLSCENYLKDLANIDKNEILYLTNLQHTKKVDRAKIFALIQEQKAVLVTSDLDEDMNISTINIDEEDDIFNCDDILSIESYVKYIISNFQSRFPDTELSKKLGISRKSLWERRKRYGINKDK